MNGWNLWREERMAWSGMLWRKEGLMDGIHRGRWDYMEERSIP